MNSKRMDLTEHGMMRTMLTFSFPFIISFLLQSVYGMVDLMVVGRFGGTFALAGVNMGTQIMDLILCIATGLLSGGTVIISQKIGAKKEEELPAIIGTIACFILVLAVVLSGVMLLFGKQVMQIMQTPQESYAEAFNYYRICMCGTIFIYGYNVTSAVYRGLGDSKTPLAFVVVSTVINIVLDLFFVARLEMGAGGAALATIIAQAISCVSSTIYLLKNAHRYGLNFNVSVFRIDKKILKRFLKISVPAALQEVLLIISLVIVILVANILGVYEAAAVGTCAKVNVIFILPVIALNVSLSIIIGQNTGAGKKERIREACLVNLFFSTGYSLLVLAAWTFFGEWIMELFTSDTQTILLGASYLKYHRWDYFLVMPIGYCLGGLFTGTGHTMVVAISMAVGSFLSRIPLMVVLALTLDMGVSGIALSFPISTVFCDLVYCIALGMGIWKKPVLIHSQTESI